MVDPAVGERLHVLQDDRVSHQGQPIALVLADTLEQANYAATLVRVIYASETGTTDISRVEPVLPTPQQNGQPSETRRGDPEGALARAEVKGDQTYVIPRENHNPIEMHATIAAWDGDRLTLWDKTQWVHNVADEIGAVFGIPAENVRVVSPFVGGAFGSALRAWPHVTLAALGARVAKRPVKLMLSRREMYYAVGYRPHTVQRVALGASRDGRLAAIVHDAFQETSTYVVYSVALLNASRRTPQPRSMRDGRWLIGWGMATATYPMNYAPASAMARLLPDGTAEVTSAASDMGPGTWTSMTQVAAEALGLPIERVRFILGDTELPQAPVHGGSMTMASVGSAVQAACRKVRETALAGADGTDMVEVMARLDRPLEAVEEVQPGEQGKGYSKHAFGAVFVEVAVDPDLGETRVRRIVGAYGAGRVVNPK